MATDDEFSKVLMHFNGADESTVFTDESGKIWTPAGNAQLDTTIKKFGTASGEFDGTADYLTTPTHADLEMGSGDFTVDFWIYLNAATTNNEAIYGPGTDTATHIEGFAIIKNPDGTIGIWASSDGTTWDIRGDVAGKGSIVLSSDTWHHIALVRNGNDWLIFVDGVKDLDVTVAGAVFNGGQPYNIARNTFGGGTGRWWVNGFIDEFRLSKGIARWTANFTPPTSEYVGLDFVFTKDFKLKTIYGLEPRVII